MNKPLLHCIDLEKTFIKRGFFGKKTVVHAVDQINLEIQKGEILGLVGESGCGKTTLARTMIRMYRPDGGKIYYHETDITTLEGKALDQYRKKMQIIFQDPYSSLNPYLSVREIIEEPILRDLSFNKEQREERIVQLMEQVGLKTEYLSRYPHEFSGGQRQRIGIARALSTNPEFILCDEPISALDVSIQAQVINTLQDLKEQQGLTYLFVAHDLSMVHHISDRVAVMYLGQIVEIAETKELYENTLHPYTKALMSAIPIADPKLSREVKRERLEGEVPSPINLPTGCRFHTRCPYKMKRCEMECPTLQDIGNGHCVSCHLYQK